MKKVLLCLCLLCLWVITTPFEANKVESSGIDQEESLRDAVARFLVEHPELQPSGYKPLEMGNVRIGDGWALLNVVAQPDNVLPDTHSSTNQYILLMLARQQSDQEWEIVPETDEQYAFLIDSMPESFLPLACKQVLNASAQNRERTPGTFSIPYFPWEGNFAWRYNSSPAHDSSDYGFDFGTNPQGESNRVYAADEGCVIDKEDTCLWIQRTDGFILFYQHLQRQNVAEWDVGDEVNVGDFLGQTIVEYGCHGPTNGHHVHFAVKGPNNERISPEGSTINGWLIEGPSSGWVLRKGEQIVRPRLNELLHNESIVGDIGGRVLGVNNEPVADATIEVSSRGIITKTDSNGLYEIRNLPPGPLTVKASKDTGNREIVIEVVPNQQTVVNIQLEYSCSRRNLTTGGCTSDETSPSATGFSANFDGSTVNFTVQGVQDNPGGTGIREVRYSARFNNAWQGVGVATQSPYGFSWNTCEWGTPDGDIELGMEVWDNAGNKWVWSEHFPNPHLNKNYNCTPPPPEAGVYIYRNTGQSGDVCHITQDIPSTGNHCGSNWNDDAESIRVVGDYYFALYKDDWYGGGQPLTGNFSDNLPDGWRNEVSSVRVRRTNPAAVTFYDLGDYNGESWSTDRTIYDMEHWGWNDKAESVRIAGGYSVVICNNASFHDSCGRVNGPAEFSDINALAQGLRNGTSSVRICNGECPTIPAPPLPELTSDDGVVTPNEEVLLQWGGNGNQFRAEMVDQSGNSGWHNGTQWELGTLPESSTPYTWRVKAWTPYGESAWSDEYQFWVQNAPELPASPSNLHLLTANEEKISLAWADNSPDETEFRVYRWEWQDREWLFVPIGEVESNQITYTDTGLNCGTVYYYRVSAQRDNVESGLSDTLFAATALCLPYDLFLPTIENGS